MLSVARAYYNEPISLTFKLWSFTMSHIKINTLPIISTLENELSTIELRQLIAGLGKHTLPNTFPTITTENELIEKMSSTINKELFTRTLYEMFIERLEPEINKAIKATIDSLPSSTFSELVTQFAYDQSISDVLINRVSKDGRVIDLLVNDFPLTLIQTETQEASLLMATLDDYQSVLEHPRKLVKHLEQSGFTITLAKPSATKEISFLALISEIDYERDIAHLTDLDLDNEYTKCYCDLYYNDHRIIIQNMIDKPDVIIVRPQFDFNNSEKQEIKKALLGIIAASTSHGFTVKFDSSDYRDLIIK